MTNMENKNEPDFEAYGIKKQSPMQMIEEFALMMQLQHFIQVTGIDFKDDGIDKIVYSFHPKERVVLCGEPSTNPKNIDPNLPTRIWTSAGPIRLGTAEEDLS